MEIAVDGPSELQGGGKYNARLQTEVVAKTELCSPTTTMHWSDPPYSRPTCGGDASQPIPNSGVINRKHRHQILRVRGQVGKPQRGDCSI